MAALQAKPGIDLPNWEALGAVVGGAGVGNGLGAGSWMDSDLRNNDYAHPVVYYNSSLSILKAYFIKANAWQERIGTSSNFGAGGTFGNGATSCFVPSLSPSGTIAAGATTSSLTLTTALPASVAANQLANRGDGLGFIVRIIGNAAGSSGKTEERRVIANTSGTTPTIYLDSPLSFTPANGDRYEFLSGSYVFLGTGALAANQFRRYDCLTGALSSLSTTNLIAIVPATGNCLVALEPGYVPHDRKSGEGQLVGAGTYNGGLFGCLTATATAAGTLTGESASGDYQVPANQFRNYQIRIVEDTATPTAVGQVRRISSHTAGSSPVYTLASNWTVTPSSTCKYVIEHFGDRIIGFMGGTTTVYNYSISGNTWDTTTWAARGSSAQTAGAFCFLAHGMKPNSTGTINSSKIFCFRGNSATPDILDIAGASTGSWTTAASIGNYASPVTIDAFGGTEYIYMAYNPHSQDGKYLYFMTGSGTTVSSNRAFTRLDCHAMQIEKFQGPLTTSGASAALTFKGAFITLFYDGTNKVPYYVCQRPAGAASEYWRLLICF